MSACPIPLRLSDQAPGAEAIAPVDKWIARGLRKPQHGDPPLLQLLLTCVTVRAMAEGLTLDLLKVGQHGVVESVGGRDPNIELKLREIGFAEGDRVELLQRGPFGGGAIAVVLNASIIALRRAEAAHVRIRPATG